MFWLTQRRAAGEGGRRLIEAAVVSRTPTVLGLLALLLANATYYGMLFSLAQYFQQGLGRGATASGVILVGWVAAGQLTRRLPARLMPVLPAAGYLMLSGAFLAIAATLFAGEPPDGLLAVLLTFGGLGLGTGFTALIGDVTVTGAGAPRGRHQRHQHHPSPDRRRSPSPASLSVPLRSAPPRLSTRGYAAALRSTAISPIRSS